ncbi:DUF2520 domain-containing protein [Leucobacter sp. CSA2]|uniref:DUF2520 domain-containing protein n=2 Tax=Leucobacter edaphi TaxID=2796472 RepID=A0A934QED8_9MICO|nr:DUF2520 domain-containing protein [Leucobacter edaphi]MBK0422275.1 DUF2520 domain-containing protein [Leucobacter edaphi]
MGRALVPALAAAGHEVLPPAGRGADGRDPSGAPVDVVLLAVPDAAIADAAALICDGPLIGHLSGATPLSVFAGRSGVFSVHPLLSVTGPETDFAGSWAAVDSDSPSSASVAAVIVEALGLRPFSVADHDRAAYHAAASIAANFLITLEGAAEDLGRSAGVPREALLALARGSLENWGRVGAAEALTGPVVRGDADTVARQRAAVAERLHGELALFDALVAATERLAGRTRAHRTTDRARNADTGEPS